MMKGKMKGNLWMFVIFSIIVVIFLVPNFFQHLAQTPKDIGKIIDDNAPISHVRGIVENELSKARHEMQDAWISAYNMKRDKENMQASLDGHIKQLTKCEKIIKEGAQLLKSSKPGEQVSIGNILHSYEEIGRDIVVKIDTCKSLKKIISQEEEVIAGLQVKYDQAVAYVESSKRLIEDEERLIASQEAEFRALHVINGLESKYGNMSGEYDVGSNLKKAREMWNSRLEKERAIYQYNNDSIVSSSINWDSGVSSQGDDALDLAVAYLDDAQE